MVRHAGISAGLFALLIFFFLSFPPLAPGAEADRPSLVDRYRQALEIDPDNLRLRYYLGVALLGRGENAAALEELRRSYPQFQDSIEANYNLGIAHLLTGDGDSALLHFEQAEALGAGAQPDVYPLTDAYYNLAVMYFEQDDRAEALRLFRRVLHLSPERHEIERLIGDIHARNGEDEAALAAFDRYLQAFPTDQSIREYVFSLHFNRGMVALEEDRLERAREMLQKALDYSPESPLALYYLAYISYREVDLPVTVAILHRAFRVAENEVRESVRTLIFNVATKLLDQRKPKSALDALSVVLEASDVSVDELYLAGNIHLMLGEFVAAREHYEAVLARDERHEGATLNLVSAEIGALDELFSDARQRFDDGDYLTALKRFELMLEINAADPRALKYAAECRFNMQRLAEESFAAAALALEAGDPYAALEAVRNGLELVPADEQGQALEDRATAALHEQIEESLAAGNAALAEKRFAVAATAFDRVLQLDPDNAAAGAGRAAVDRQRGEYARALVDDGEAALGEGNLAAARTAFEAALRVEPELPPASDGLAKIDALVASLVTEELQWARRAAAAGRLTEAREHFRKALQLQDDSDIRAEMASLEDQFSQKISSLLQQADRFATQEEFQRARNIYRQVLVQVPDHAAATLALAALEERAAEVTARQLAAAAARLADDDYHAAVVAYRKVLDIEPTNRQALSGLERARERSRTRLTERLTAADAAMADRDWSRAEAIYREVLQLDPYQQPAKDGLKRLESLRSAGLQVADVDQLYLDGIKYYTGGDYEGAVTVWQQVLQLSPDHDKARRNIEKARRKLQFIRERQNG